MYLSEDLSMWVKTEKIEFMIIDGNVLHELPYDFWQELGFCFRVGNFF